MKKIALSLAAALLASTVAACTKKAEGQVAAVVNGEEITLQEVNAETGASVAPAGVDKDRIRQQALQRIIERRLLAQAAKEDGLDQSAEYLIQRRKLDDALLVQMLAKRIGSTVGIPTAAKVDELINQRPLMFDQREVLTMDRIEFAMPKDAANLKPLENAHSMEAVAATLNKLGITFVRGPAEADTATIDENILRQIKALPSGEPFILPQGNMVTAAVVTGSRPIPSRGDAAKPIAANVLREQNLRDLVQRRLKTAMAEAKIEYQPGLAPAKGGAVKTAASGTSDARK